MNDKKKYEHIVSDIFDTFMQDLGDKLKEPKPDGDLANEKEETEDDEEEKEDSSFSIALEVLDKIIDDVMSKIPEKDMPDDLEPELDDSDKA